MNPIRVTVFCEHNQDRSEPVKSVYPRGMHAAIAAGFTEEEGFLVRVATQEMEDHGLSDAVLDATDVLVWWSHLDNALIDDRVAGAVCTRVARDGMGFIALHSASFSKPWQRLLGLEYDGGAWGRYRTLPEGERQRLWVVAPDHPICRGIEDCIEIPRDEMYGEPMLMPEPDKLLLISWWEGGEVCRSGTLFERGRGKIFGFTAGHEAFPVYYQKEVRRLLRNAARYLSRPDTLTVKRAGGHLGSEPREPFGRRS